MGKRQFRILPKDLFSKQAELVGRKGHVILSDHVVYTGLIRQITASQLTLENARQGKQQINMTTILEVVYDQETEY